MSCFSLMSHRTLAAAVILAVTGATPAAAQFKRDAPIRCEDIDSVGTAQMSADGVITLHLHTLWPEPKAEGMLSYAPDDPQYEEIKRHLGGIAPGESKPVPPLCGLNSEP
jgi:hypothetical protein